MKLEYNHSDLIKIYNNIVKRARQYSKNEHFERAISSIRCASFLQYEINDIFCDPQLNKIVREISLKLLGVVEPNEQKRGNFVFYDYSGLDNKGLTQQYLDAIFKIENVSLLYIHETVMKDASSHIRLMLESNHAKIVELGNMSYEEKTNVIYSLIKEFEPEKIFCHLHPATSIPLLIALYAFPSIEKYNINLTDHAFWVGGPDLFNYNFEFREKGAFLSFHKRGFKRKQLLLLPFYPWHDNGKFEGFPAECDNKIKVFSGGALYKIEGSENDFLDIVKAILSISGDVVFIIAGAGDTSYLYSYIKKNNLTDKVYYIGQRHDIYEVVNHIDIFLGTYPIGGGLMTQYAALCGKPILAYKGESLVELMKPRKDKTFSFETKGELLEEAQKLIKDIKYRKEKGNYNTTLIPSQRSFQHRFRNLIFEHNCVSEDVERVNIPLENFYDAYLNRINDSHMLTIELPILKATNRFMHWKVFCNTLFNFYKIIRFI